MASIKKNLAYNVIYQTLVIILPLITAPYVSRTLGAENTGIWSYTYSVAHYFVILALLGVKNYGNRSIAQVRDDQRKLSSTFWEIFGLQLLTSALMGAAYIVYVCVVVKENGMIAVLQFLYVISAANDISWFFFGIERFKLTVVRSMVIRILCAMAVFLFIRDQGDLWKYVVIMGMSVCVSQASIWPFLPRYVVFIKPRFRDIMKHLKPNLVLFIPVVAISLYNIMDKIMVGAVSSMTQAGYYENTDKIINVPYGVITALGTVMLPRMSHLMAKGDITKGKYYIGVSIRFTMFTGCAMTFGIAGISKVLAPVFFGTEFVTCGPLIMAIAPAVLFKAWANVVRTQYLIPCSRDRDYMISVAAGAVVNVILNSILIVRLDAMGAVIGTVAAEGVVCLLQTLSVRKELPIRRYLKEGCVFVSFGILMFLAVYQTGIILGDSIRTLALQIMAGGVIYLALSLTYLVLKKDEIVMEYIGKAKKLFGVGK